MNIKYVALSLVIAAMGTFGTVGFATASGEEVEVTIENLSKTILTPPIIAVTENGMKPFHALGESSSEALEQLAEGGDTTPLKEYYEAMGARVVQLTDPIPPGESVTVKVPGFRRSGVTVGSMLLPTNDAFIGANLFVKKNKRSREASVFARAYDAGTEDNTENFSDIPGPFGGEGFNSDRDDVDFVHPHPGIQGVGDASAKEYDWADPVARVTAKVVR